MAWGCDGSPSQPHAQLWNVGFGHLEIAGSGYGLAIMDSVALASVLDQPTAAAAALEAVNRLIASRLGPEHAPAHLTSRATPRSGSCAAGCGCSAARAAARLQRRTDLGDDVAGFDLGIIRRAPRTTAAAVAAIGVVAGLAVVLDPGAAGAASAIAPITGHRAAVSDTAALKQGCANVLFLGVRGSGDASAFGTDVQIIATQVTTLLPQSTSLRQVYVDYTAPTVQSIFTKGIAPYFDSATAAQTKVQAVLQDSAARCPNEKWVLAGYSQGALALNKASRNVATDAHLAALELVGDPARTLPGSGINYGTASAHAGVYSLAFPSAAPLPDAVAAKTYQLCDNQDIVCDTTAPYYGPLVEDSAAFLAGDTAVLAPFSTLTNHGVDIHTRYNSRNYHSVLALGTVAASLARSAT
jgi:Cutinase